MKGKDEPIDPVVKEEWGENATVMGVGARRKTIKPTQCDEGIIMLAIEQCPEWT